MGWNDHVDMVETECQECGVVDTWEYWDEVALGRYGGENSSLGEYLGHDATRSGRCPHCGSSRGEMVDENEDEAWWPDD